MGARMSNFSFRPAIRSNVQLLLGLAGPSGSGKTYSAMRLASGLSGDKRFCVIDTENGRASHYADMFKFDVCDLREPFRPDSYADAILAAEKAGYDVIVVDSMSHSWAGSGGVLDYHETELDRLAGSDFRKRETMTMLAWAKPKQSHKQMVQRLLQVKAHVILCFRAEEKIEIVKEDGKTKIVPKKTLTGINGFVPVCDKTLPFELTVSFLMTPDAPGFPKPIKLQEQHKALFPLDKPINEESGRLVALWAAGGKQTTDPNIKRLEDAINGAGFDVADVLKAWKKNSLSEVADVEKALAWIAKQTSAPTTTKTALTAQSVINRLLAAKDIDILKADYELISQLPESEHEKVNEIYMECLDILGRK